MQKNRVLYVSMDFENGLIILDNKIYETKKFDYINVVACSNFCDLKDLCYESRELEHNNLCYIIHRSINGKRFIEGNEVFSQIKSIYMTKMMKFRCNIKGIEIIIRNEK